MRQLHPWIQRRFIKRKRIRLCFRLIGLILFFGLTSQKVNAQDIEMPYERALLDSSILYERLKPIHSQLRTAYDFQSKELSFVRTDLQVHKLQAGLREKEFATILKVAKKESKKDGLKIGGFWAFVGTAIAFSILKK